MDHQDFLSTIIPSSMAYPDTEIAPRDSPNSLLGWEEQLHRIRGYRSKIVVGCLLSVSISLWAISTRSCRLVNYFDPVDGILRTAPLIDGHNDFPIWIRAFHQNHIHNLTNASSIDGQVDFPRLRQGRLNGQFWSVYVPCPKNDDDYADKVYGETVHDTLQQLDLVHILTQRFPTHLQQVNTANEVWANFAKSNAISSFTGAEGLHQICNSASILRMYHRLGMRYITLTHDCHNKYADSAAPSKPLHGGLSPAGTRLLLEMNRIGMMIDLSHTSASTMRMALNTSKAPVLFSHSSSFTLCPHPRNVPDDVLRTLKSNGGVVMITFYPEYVRCQDAHRASLADVANHIQYIGQLIGFQHVGLGSDFDGMAKGPLGLEDVSKYPALVRELIERGLSHEAIAGVVGGNVLRVLRQVELVAASMSNVSALEDDVKPMFE